MKQHVIPAEGRLGILIPGLGAVATTFIAGVESVKKGLALPIGSLTQMSNIRLGKRTENRMPKIKEFVPLADLNDIAFGGWDIYQRKLAIGQPRMSHQYYLRTASIGLASLSVTLHQML